MGGGLVIRFDVVTLFPEMFAAVAGSGITSRALDAGLWSLTTWNPRDFTTDHYRTVDDRPYGGGPGMVMLAEPLERALDAVAKSGGSRRTIYLSPQGRKLDHPRVMELVKEPAVTLLCGRYEGVDERLLAQLGGLESREAALKLKGSKVFVPREALPKAQEGHYYLADLLGLEVVNERGEALGVVKRWMFNGAQDVMEVAGDRTHLVPWIPAVVRKVDLQQKRIEVEWGADW